MMIQISEAESLPTILSLHQILVIATRYVRTRIGIVTATQRGPSVVGSFAK